MNNKQQTKKTPLPTRFQQTLNVKVNPEQLISKAKKMPSKLQCNLGSLQTLKLKSEQCKFVGNCPGKETTKTLPKEMEQNKSNKNQIQQRKSDYEKRDVYCQGSITSREVHAPTAFSVGRVKPTFPVYVSHKNVYKTHDMQQNTTVVYSSESSQEPRQSKRLSSFRKVSFDTNAIRKTIIDIANSRSSNKGLASRLTCDSANECQNLKAPARKIANLLNSNSTVLLSKRQLFEPHSPVNRLLEPSTTSFLSISLRVSEHLSSRQNSYGKFSLRDSSHQPFQGQRFNPFVQFITEVACKVDFKERVLFLAIELFYFALRLKPLREFEFKALALSAVGMAAKFEDAWSFYVCPFFTLDCVASSKPEMIEVERQLLAALDFNLNLVLVYDLFSLFSSLIGLSKEQRDFGLYFLNSALCFEDFQQSDKRSTAFALCVISAKAYGCPIAVTEVASEGQLQLVVMVKNNLTPNNSETETTELVFDASKVEETVTIFEKHEKTVLSRKGRAISDLYSRPCFSGVAERF